MTEDKHLLGLQKIHSDSDLSANQILSSLPNYDDLPYWTVIIHELVVGAKYSYSRIAQRIGVCPSTIQKLATDQNRKPRPAIFHRLLLLYYKVFYGPYVSPQIKEYLSKREVLMENIDFEGVVCIRTKKEKS